MKAGRISSLGGATIYLPHEIDEGSWLLDEQRFAWFVRGYRYAMTQTRALPALAQVTPEQLYEAVWAVMRGAGLPDPEEPTRDR